MARRAWVRRMPATLLPGTALAPTALLALLLLVLVTGLARPSTAEPRAVGMATGHSAGRPAHGGAWDLSALRARERDRTAVLSSPAGMALAVAEPQSTARLTGVQHHALPSAAVAAAAVLPCGNGHAWPGTAWSSPRSGVRAGDGWRSRAPPGPLTRPIGGARAL